jgi:HPt (histidine-containing phosphotransfer) domain-containing protein
MHEGDDWPDVAHIDSTIVREQIGGDTQLFLRLLNGLVESYSDINVSVIGGYGTYRIFAGRMHKLKGAAATLGATRICELAAQTEAAIAACDDATMRRCDDATMRRSGVWSKQSMQKSSPCAMRLRRLLNAVRSNASLHRRPGVSNTLAIG